MKLKIPGSWYSADCRDCPRLSAFLDEVKAEHADYFCKPVPPFGDLKAELVIVGLAPGKHGANATGRPFTGDYAGVLLYDTLHKFGFATNNTSEHVDDGLKLINCRITNAVKCLPPQNKPIGSEEKTCNHFLNAELSEANIKVILTLGQLAHRSILRGLELRQADYKFGHGACHELPDGRLMINSYHCSRYNTQTKRLTEEMFHSVFSLIKEKMTK